MNQNFIKFETETEAAELLTYLENGVYNLQIEDFTLDKGIDFKKALTVRSEAAKRMRRFDISFTFQGKGGGLFEIETQNNKLIDLNAQSKRSKLIDVFNKLNDGETATFNTQEIDPVYCRSVLSKIGQPYTTKLENGVIYVTKTNKRFSASAYLKEQINNLENKGIIDFYGDISYLRQIASGMRTPKYRYSIKQIDSGKYEITRLYYEDIKPKSDYYDIIKQDFVDFYLDDNEIVLLNSIVEKLKNKINGTNVESVEPIPVEKPTNGIVFKTADELKAEAQNQTQYAPYSEVDDAEDYNPDDILDGFKMPDLGPDMDVEF